MSKLTDVAATSHTVSVTAMEEASRLGMRTADIDHMLLALTVNEQVAGQVLRSLGVTLGAAREAVAAQHAEQIAALGIRTEAPEPGRITFHETGVGEWSERAIDLIKRSAQGKKRGDAAALLRELVAEPSGFIDAILHRLGTTPGDVIDRLDVADRPEAAAARAEDPDAISGSSTCFIPASIPEVWGLLADPSRMPIWEPTVGRVDDVPGHARVGASWGAGPSTVQSGSKPARIRPGTESMRVEILACAQQQLLEWRLSWPDAPKTNMKRTRVELEPAAGGTQLRLVLAWERSTARAGRRPRLRRWLLRPLHRFALWIQLNQLGASISRAFR